MLASASHQRDQAILSEAAASRSLAASNHQQDSLHKRLELLRILLASKTRGRICSKQALAEQTHGIFDQLLAAWEAFTAAVAAKEEQEAELFKSKTRETKIKSEEVSLLEVESSPSTDDSSVETISRNSLSMHVLLCQLFGHTGDDAGG